MTSSHLKRADIVLVERGFFESRAKAREAIEAGLVLCDGKPVRKASEPIGADANISAQAPYPWVSRGGLKLAAALDHFLIDPNDRVCLDIGASTGGFTDVLLSRGARKVWAIDVGHSQLHPRIAADPRVVSREGVDARSLEPFDPPPSLIVCDVSFISLKLVWPHVLPLAAPDALLISLIKPQFEAGRDASRKGIVRDAAIHARVCAEIGALAKSLGWTSLGVIPSPIEGGDGNREFLIGARRSTSP